MDRFSLISRANGERALADSWPYERSWSELVGRAASEDDESAPFTSVIWEVLWRLDPNLLEGEARIDGPPDEPGSLWHVNPFLSNPDSTVHAALFEMLQDFDADVADIYASAVRAERLPEWPSPREIVRSTARALRVERSKDFELMAFDGVDLPRPEGFGARPGWVPNTLDLDDSVGSLDDYELALTRLALIGHGPTSRRVLPSLLLLSPPDEPDSLLTEVSLIRIVLQRLEPRLRFGVASATLNAILRQRPRDSALEEVRHEVAGSRVGRNSRLVVATVLALAPLRERGLRSIERHR